MMKRIFTTLLIILTALPSFAQESNTYKGVVVNKDKTPVDVFSVVVFNTQDSTKQLYANTFSNGDFSFEFTQSETEKYGVYLLAMGYSDTRIPLEKMRDTVTLHNSSMKIDDVVVQGKRSVLTSIGDGGGVLFDVSNTYLSNLGESTQLLNFIPGINADKDGNVSLIGIGEAVIYINNIMQDDPEKLKSIKSEDVKSVEVLRMPGAKYKNAAAVILIKTNRAIDGIKTNVGISGYISDKGQYSIAPNLDISYTKNRITVSGAYGYNTGESIYENNITREINDNILPDKWSFESRSETKDMNNQSHWYKANLDYRINDKNIITFQYRGQHQTLDKETNTNEYVKNGILDKLYSNSLYSLSDQKHTTNTAHVYYRGEYSSKFNIEFNADYSNKSYDNSTFNNWMLDGESNPTIFTQPSLQKADAFTADILLSNTIKDKHIINYGVEYAYLKDDVQSTDIQDNSTSYIQNSTFIKGILEYKTSFAKCLGLYVGANYLYSNIKDNNTISKGQNYNNIVPYLSLQYYNQNKKYSISLDVRYNYTQPAAGLLDDKTITYISPYEIKTGNKNLKNSENITSSLSFNYKNIQIGIMNQVHYNLLYKYAEVVKIQDNGTPMIIGLPKNLDRTCTGTGLSVGYSNKFGFWTPSIYGMLVYTYGKIPQTNNSYQSINGFQGVFYLNNHFELPKGFHIYLNGKYITKGYDLLLYQGEKYYLNLFAEKRFLNDQLRISIDLQGIIVNKYTKNKSTIFDITKNSNSYDGWYRHIGISATWRFNNHKAIQNSKDNEYLNML